MEFELKGALKKYRRMRSWRRAGMAIMAVGAMISPWVLDLGRTDTLLCWLGAFIVWMLGELEMRMKTIQVRLAGMSDQLNALTHRYDQRPDEDLILELNDW
jgi:hypothetical protein